jgi:RNA polymerase sigma-70 factor (ECF subfamily)
MNLSFPSFSRDPLANPEPLIRRVYAYAAYRLGDGPDAEDVTSEVFERALRYRHNYDRSKGEPAAWLLGIAQRCTSAALAARAHDQPRVERDGESEGFEDDSIRRLTLAAALSQLSDRDQELIALRFGADLTAAQIARVLDGKTNAVEVALHRALARLRSILESENPNEASVNPGVRVSRRATVSVYETGNPGEGIP